MERVQRWIENNGVLYYKIQGLNGSNVLSRNSESTEECQLSFEQDYESLPDGKYIILGSKNASVTDKRAFRLQFQIGGIQQKTSDGMDSKMIEMLYSQARKDIKIEYMEEDIKVMKVQIRKLAEIVAELKDESDGDEDKDVLTKIVDSGEKLKSGLDMLKDFKL